MLFGLIHITNFEFSYTILLLSPILVAPQIILGFFIGFLRVRYGFVLGFLMHALHNAVFIGFGLFSMLNHSEKNVETSLYSIKIEETNDIDSPSTQHNYPDSIAYKNVSLKTTLSYLLNTNEILLQTNDEKMFDKQLNLNFKNKSKDSSQTKSIALNQLAKSYDFTIKKNTIQTEVWHLKIMNPKILGKYKTENNSYGNMVTINSEEIIIKNSKIKTLVNALTKESNTIIFDKTDIKDNYNFTLKTKDFESLNSQLKYKYGLYLVKQKKNMEHIRIVFPKQK